MDGLARHAEQAGRIPSIPPPRLRQHDMSRVTSVPRCGHALDRMQVGAAVFAALGIRVACCSAAVSRYGIPVTVSVPDLSTFTQAELKLLRSA